MDPASSRSMPDSFEPFTPQFSPLPEKLLPNVTLRDNEPSDSSSDSETVTMAEPAHWNPFEELGTHKTSVAASIDHLFYYDQRFFDNLEFSDLTSDHVRKYVWQMAKYQRSDFFRRIEFCLRASLTLFVFCIVLSQPTVEAYLVDKVYILIFIIMGIQPTFTESIMECFLGLVGVALATVAPMAFWAAWTAADGPAAASKGAAFAVIVVTTVVVVLFVQGHKDIRLWFVVHNIYYFWLFLNGAGIWYPFRQLLEFSVISVVCCLANLIPYPGTLHLNFKYRVRKSFEQSLAIFKLLLLVLSQPSSGKTTGLLAHAHRRMARLEKARDLLQSISDRLWLELIFDLDTFLYHKIVVTAVNNMALFLGSIIMLAEEQTLANSKEPEKGVIEAMENFIRTLEIYTADAVEAYLDRGHRLKIEYRLDMKRALDVLWTQFRNARYRELYTKSDDVWEKAVPAVHMAKDYQMFCVSNFFYSITLLDQICVRRRSRKSNLHNFSDFLKAKLGPTFRWQTLKTFLTTGRTYLTMVQNSVPVLVCTAIAFFTPLYPQTMSLVFPVGFCWVDRMAGTFQRSTQRLMGAIFGCFYGGMVVLLAKDNIYIKAASLFGLVFVTKFINANERYSYFANVFGYTACWVLFTSFNTPGMSVDDEIFNRIKMTFLGMSISIAMIMLLRPRRAITMIFAKMGENLKLVRDIVENQKEIFSGADNKQPPNNDSVYKAIKKTILTQADNNSWEPLSLSEFVKNDTLTCLNGVLFRLQENISLIQSLQLESSSEPKLFFKDIDADTLKQIDNGVQRLSHFIIISAHASNDKDIQTLAQFEAVCLDHSAIFTTIENSLENICDFFKTPSKASGKRFESEMDRARIIMASIDHSFELYYTNMKRFLLVNLERGTSEDVSFEHYRIFWGLGPYLFALKRIFSSIVVLQQVLIFSCSSTGG